MFRTALITFSLLAGSAFADSFVALAYDHRAMIGATATAADASAAQEEALALCGEQAADCKLRLTRADSCVALALDYTSGGWGSFSSRMRSTIAVDVVDRCASFGNENCTLSLVQCAATVVETN